MCVCEWDDIVIKGIKRWYPCAVYYTRSMRGRWRKKKNKRKPFDNRGREILRISSKFKCVHYTWIGKITLELTFSSYVQVPKFICFTQHTNLRGVIRKMAREIRSTLDSYQINNTVRWYYGPMGFSLGINVKLKIRVLRFE